MVSNILAVAYFSRGFAYSTKGQLDRASQDYDQAIKLDPDLAATGRTSIPAHRHVRFRTLAALKAADGKWLKLAKAVKPMRTDFVEKQPTFTVSLPFEIGTRAVKRGDVIVRAGYIDSADEPRTITVIYKSRKVFERKTIGPATAQILRDGSVFLAVSSGGNAGNYEGFYIRRGSGGKWSETEFGLCCGGQLLSELMGNGQLYLLQSGEMLDCCDLTGGHARATHSVIVYQLRGKRLVEVTEPKVIRRAVAPALAGWYRSIEEMATDSAKQDVGGQNRKVVRGSRNRISIDFHAQGLLGHALGYVVLKAQLGEIRSAWKVFRDDMGFHKDQQLLKDARKALGEYITEENELPLR